MRKVLAGVVVGILCAAHSAHAIDEAHYATARELIEKSINYLPLFHTAGINLHTLPIFLAGGLSHVLRKFEPIFLPGDLEPIGCAFPIYDEDAKKDDECRWAVWTDHLSFYVSPGGSGIEDNEDGTRDNPWGVLPVLFAHRESESSGWWRGELADVINAQSWHNWTMTYAGHAGLLQGLGVPWINSPPPPSGTSAKFGPYDVQYTDGGGMGFATSGIDLEKLPKLAREYLNSVAFAHHLRLNWAGESMATSGEHQRLLESDLSIAVQADNVRWAEFERLRVQIEAEILQAAGIGATRSDLSVNYRESHLPMSERERFELWKLERDAGLATRRDYVVMRDPDISDEQLEQRMAELDQDRPTNGGRVNPLTAALGA